MRLPRIVWRHATWALRAWWRSGRWRALPRFAQRAWIWTDPDGFAQAFEPTENPGCAEPSAVDPARSAATEVTLSGRLLPDAAPELLLEEPFLLLDEASLRDAIMTALGLGWGEPGPRVEITVRVLADDDDGYSRPDEP